MTESVEYRVTHIIADRLGVNIERVVDDANFEDNLGADSLDVVDVVMALEEEFEISISDDDAETITTVGQAVKYIEKATEKADAE